MKASAIERELHHCMTARNKRLKRGKPKGRKDATLHAWLHKIYREIKKKGDMKWKYVDSHNR